MSSKMYDGIDIVLTSVNNEGKEKINGAMDYLVLETIHCDYLYDRWSSQPF